MSLPSTFVSNFHDENVVKKMKYSIFGDTGMQVSKLSLGCAEFSSIYGDYSEDNCKATLIKSLKSGINYLDTAYWYGQNTSQEVLGRCLKDVPRSSYYLATKVGRYEQDPKEMFDFSSEKTRWCLENNLKTLGVDYIDVIQIHDIEFAPSIEYLIENTLPVLDEARKKGIVKYIGVTGYPVSALKEIVEKSPIKIDMVLSYCRFNLVDDTLKDFIPFFKEKKMGIVNASGLNMGLLSNSGPQPWHPAQDEIKTACKKARDLCIKNGTDLARLATYYIYNNPDIDTNLVGMKTLGQLDSNLDVLFNGITQKEKEILEEVKKGFVDLKVKHWEGVELEKFKNSTLKYD
nr:L-galactose dehydrogenase-like [Onthophagus taurus]